MTSEIRPASLPLAAGTGTANAARPAARQLERRSPSLSHSASAARVPPASPIQVPGPRARGTTQQPPSLARYYCQCLRVAGGGRRCSPPLSNSNFALSSLSCQLANTVTVTARPGGVAAVAAAAENGPAQRLQVLQGQPACCGRPALPADSESATEIDSDISSLLRVRQCCLRRDDESCSRDRAASVGAPRTDSDASNASLSEREDAECARQTPLTDGVAAAGCRPAIRSDKMCFKTPCKTFQSEDMPQSPK